MTRYYKEVELIEGAAVVFVGCHVLRWQREWGEPRIGFIDADEANNLQEAHDNLARQLSIANDDLEIAVETLIKIQNWTKAYPLDIFPEPDLKLANQILKDYSDGKVSLDSISASAMRHVINGVKKYVDDALAKIEGDS